MPRLLIIGGSDAGIAAALRAREMAPQLAVTVLVADAFPNYSICGLPFYLSGEVPDWHDLAHRTIAEIEAKGIELVLSSRATDINVEARSVTASDGKGAEVALPYDRLVIATGAIPVRPSVMGIDLPGVFPLHTMEDNFRVQAYLTEHQPRDAVIVGAGYIGVEMADALAHLGIAVTLVQHGPSVLATVDQSIGAIVGDELRRHGVTVVTGVAVEEIQRANGGRLMVIGSSPAQHASALDALSGVQPVGSRGFHAAADLVLVAAGVQPRTELARGAGAITGGRETREAIRVTRAMETTIPGIYAAGDCVETWHRLLRRPTYLPLGTTAHKQGRIAGENAAVDLIETVEVGYTSEGGGSHKREYSGTLGTQVVKVFDLAVARTGLLEAEARAAGFDTLTVESVIWDHKRYYPGAHELHIRISGDRRDGRLLGAQVVGHWQAEVAKRIDIFAAALFHGMLVDELNDLDLSYTPPVSSPWDPVQMAAQNWAGTRYRESAP